MSERLLVLTTPAAAHGPAVAHHVARLLREAGREPMLRVASSSSALSEFAEEGVRSGVGAVVAVGGDGTVRDAVAGILRAGADGLLGIVPAGTGNDIARNLRLPRSTEDAVQVVLRGGESRIDLGEVNGRPFLGLVVFGFAAEVGQTVNKLKAGPLRAAARRAGGRLYHLVAFHHMLWRPRVHRCALACDDAEREVDAFTVMVGNLPGTGGVFLPCPDADACDGALDVCVIQARRADGRALGLRDKARTLRAAVDGAHVSLDWVRMLRACEGLRVRMQPSGVVLADGDALPPCDEVLLRPLPGALRVLR